MLSMDQAIEVFKCGRRKATRVFLSLCTCFVTAYAYVNVEVSAAVDSVKICSVLAHPTGCWRTGNLYLFALAHFLSPLCYSCWMWQSMFVQILYSFLMLLIVRAAAVCSCCCRWLDVAHPLYSSSFLVCATSVGIVHKNLLLSLAVSCVCFLLILELLRLLVKLQALMLSTFRTD